MSAVPVSQHRTQRSKVCPAYSVQFLGRRFTGADRLPRAALDGSIRKIEGAGDCDEPVVRRNFPGRLLPATGPRHRGGHEIPYRPIFPRRLDVPSFGQTAGSRTKIGAEVLSRMGVRCWLKSRRSREAQRMAPLSQGPSFHSAAADVNVWPAPTPRSGAVNVRSEGGNRRMRQGLQPPFPAQTRPKASPVAVVFPLGGGTR